MPGGGSVLRRAVCAVLSELLAKPNLLCTFDLQGDLQEKEEFGFEKLLFAPVRSAWVSLAP